MDKTKNIIDTLKAASMVLGFTIGQFVGIALATTKGGVAIVSILFMFATIPFLYQVTRNRPVFTGLVFAATPFVVLPIVAMIYYLLGWRL